MAQPVYVYRIVESDEEFCVQARSMQNALMIAEEKFVSENADDSWDLDELPSGYYQRVLLKSCELLGELANPGLQPAA